MALVLSGQDEQTLGMVQRSAELMGLNRPHVHQKPLDFAHLRETLTVRLARAS